MLFQTGVTGISLSKCVILVAKLQTLRLEGEQIIQNTSHH